MAREGDSSSSQRRPDQADCLAVIELVSEGQSLRAACRALGLHAPSTHTMIDADASKGGLREQYARGRELRAEHFQEEALTVTKAAALGQKVGGQKVDASGARAYLDAIKWAAARMSPKTAPVTRLAHSFEGLSDDELDARLEQLGGG